MGVILFSFNAMIMERKSIYRIHQTQKKKKKKKKSREQRNTCMRITLQNNKLDMLNKAASYRKNKSINST